MFENLNTKINAWNLVTVLATASVAQFAHSCDGFFSIVFACITVPGILSLFNKVTFQNDKYFSADGIDLSNKLPINFTFIIVVFVISVFISETIMDNLLFFMSLPMLFFILNNVPISILFNKNSWQNSKEVYGILSNPNNTNVKSSTTDPKRFWSIDNIYYHRDRK